MSEKRTMPTITKFLIMQFYHTPVTSSLLGPNILLCTQSSVTTAAMIHIVVLWVVTPYSMTAGTYCLHLQGSTLQRQYHVHKRSITLQMEAVWSSNAGAYLPEHSFISLRTTTWTLLCLGWRHTLDSVRKRKCIWLLLLLLLWRRRRRWQTFTPSHTKIPPKFFLSQQFHTDYSAYLKS